MISFETFVLEEDGPIYRQIIRFVKRGIASGTIKDREEAPSRRALSALLGVNPNTVQKAYHILEEEGIIVSRSGAKSYVCVGEGTVERIRGELTAECTADWAKAMKQLGIGREEAFELAAGLWEKA
ncbi:MAG: GntR family transcriptional regulator [bacterium]|nr:GntR family transcriptional regulator [bacterium]